MTTTDQNLTTDYLNSILADVRKIDELSDRYAEFPTPEQIRNCADEMEAELYESPEIFTNEEKAEYRAEIDELRADAAWIQENLPDHDTNTYAMAYLADVLDLEVFAQWDQNDYRWEPSEIRALVAYGGPTARISYPGTGNYVTVTVTWGDTATAETYAPAVADAMNELLEMHPR
jgi:hypothetical protein